MNKDIYYKAQFLHYSNGENKWADLGIVHTSLEDLEEILAQIQPKTKFRIIKITEIEEVIKEIG